MLLDYVNETLRSFQFNNVTLAATSQGASADWATSGDGEFSIAMQLIASVPTVANVTNLVVQAEESPSGTGSWTVISGVNSADYGITQMILTVTATTAGANLFQAIMGLRTQRYVRMNANTFAATTATGAFGLSGFLISGKKRQPGFGTGEGGFSRSPSV
jgi:hypothetical protein